MNTKLKIKEQVKRYRRLFPGEYKKVTEQIKRLKGLKGEFADIEGEHVIEQHMFEMPETLHNMISTALNDEEWKEWSEGMESKKMVRWFARTFPEFTVPDKI